MTPRALVAVSRCGSYDTGEVARALESALEPLGGMESFVRPGQSVFLKVNLLLKADPARAVTTHPELVRAVIRSARSCGASDIAVGDSPGGRTTAAGARSIFETSGLAAVCAQENARTVLLDDEIVRRTLEGGKLYSSFNLGRQAVEADVLINLPKLKTHGFMMFTGAVKNLFGCIPGLEKAQFHLKVPDRDDFAQMLVDLLLACRPGLNIMDAVVAMEGDGPSGGTPRQTGALLASPDAVALDLVASAIAGYDPMEVYTNRAAAGRGLAPGGLDGVDVVGADWRELVMVDFRHPVRDVSRNLPPAVARWVRQRTASRPRLDRPQDCTGCSTCEKSCPVRAIDMSRGHPVFDDAACVRCYCCQELCPQQAIGLRTPWLVRAVLARETGRSV
jgi:uncharacterized protein (DUF362 family)/Pyruvate/2-oxoacid:ferredoxin oxidoreductase delta subunit